MQRETALPLTRADLNERLTASTVVDAGFKL